MEGHFLQHRKLFNRSIVVNQMILHYMECGDHKLSFNLKVKNKLQIFIKPLFEALPMASFVKIFRFVFNFFWLMTVLNFLTLLGSWKRKMKSSNSKKKFNEIFWPKFLNPPPKLEWVGPKNIVCSYPR
jgi:hypothetical protein